MIRKMLATYKEWKGELFAAASVIVFTGLVVGYVRAAFLGI